MPLVETKPATPPDPSAAPLNRPAESLAPPSRSCLNCAAALYGNYCGSCGQATRTGRITFPGLLRSLAGNILSVDSTLIRTFRALIRQPGPFIRSFVLGQRVGFARPLPYYLLIVGLNVAAVAFLRSGPSPANGAEPGSFWDQNFVALQLSLAFGALMLPLAAARRVLHPSAGYSVAEHFVWLLYVLSQSVLVTLVVRTVLWPFGISFGGRGDPEGLTWLAAFIGYALWAGRGFLFEPVWKVALKLLAGMVMVLIASGVVGLVVRRLVEAL